MSHIQDPVRSSFASGHSIRSVVARDEPEQHHLRALQDLSSALPAPEAFTDAGATLRAVVTTPDFHPGKPVPVGVVVDVDGAVLPHLIGNDIGCGMRMLALEGLTQDDLRPELEHHLRHVFFQGGRDIALTGHDRHALLREGIPGLLESLSRGREGLLARMDLDQAWKDVDRTCDDGQFSCSGIVRRVRRLCDNRRCPSPGCADGNDRWRETTSLKSASSTISQMAASRQWRGCVAEPSLLSSTPDPSTSRQHVGSSVREKLMASRLGRTEYPHPAARR